MFTLSFRHVTQVALPATASGDPCIPYVFPKPSPASSNHLGRNARYPHNNLWSSSVLVLDFLFAVKRRSSPFHPGYSSRSEAQSRKNVIDASSAGRGPNLYSSTNTAIMPPKSTIGRKAVPTRGGRGGRGGRASTGQRHSGAIGMSSGFALPIAS